MVDIAGRKINGKAAVVSDPDRRPPRPPLLAEHVPPELTALPQWVGWRWSWTKKRQWTKVPLRVKGGHQASVIDSLSWCRFDEAVAAYERGDLDGVGFVFTKDDPFCGLDFDDCRNPATGEVAQWALPFLVSLDSYTEISPSETGAKVWVRASHAGPGNKKPYGGGGVEVYDSKRYFTVTGQRLDEYSPGVQARHEEVPALWAAVLAASGSNGTSTEKAEPPPPPRGPTLKASPPDRKLDDDEVLLWAGKCNDKFAALWRGDLSGHGDDHSRADLALVNILWFWSGGDRAQVDRLFRFSELMRPKWDEKRGEKTYGQLTIDTASDGEVYRGGSGASPARRDAPRGDGDSASQRQGPSGLTLEFAAADRGRVRVTARAGVSIIYVDTLPLDSSHRRKQFIDAVAAKVPGLDAAAVERQLLDAAINPPPCDGVTTGAASDDPWPDPVNGAGLLAELCSVVQSYMVLPEHAAEILAVWLVHTYAPSVGTFTPYIWVSSPVRQCGKSTLLDVLFHLAFRAQMSDGITAAALYRRIDRVQPTMLLDELDARLRSEGGEPLRAALNSGCKVNGVVTVCSGDNNEDRDFKTFCPKVLAGIGRLWDTVMDRSIPVRLRRASAQERGRLKKVRGERIGGECLPLRRMLRRLADDLRETLTSADPPVPGELSARQQDVWRPLLAIADAVGGHWPATLREAAVAIHGQAHDEGDHGLLLLEDLKALFESKGNPPNLFSTTIVEELVKREDRPWGEYKGDKAITKTGLSYLLRRFEVRPMSVRDGGDTAKGYKLEDLEPLFQLYLQGCVSPPHRP